MSGLIHIYCGDGKGKTTAATGLAVRAAGSGKKVIFAQFLKDGSSSEIKVLKQLDNVDVCVLNTNCGFLWNMTLEEREGTRVEFTKLFNDVIKQAENDTEILVLDEIMSACNNGIVEENSLIRFLKEKPKNLEVVLTGRNPSESLIELADYVTEMRKIKHPYDKGINARDGIEF